jgi:uncharacterized protein YaaR (DUF327 family)
MAKALDFNTLKKQYFTITLPDEEKTKLLITTPDKKTFTRFNDLKTTLENSEDEGIVDELYDMVGEIMSHNKAGVKITGEYLSDKLDFEDLVFFIQAYKEFISGIVNSKN